MIYIIDSNKLSKEEKILFLSIQGLANRTTSNVYLDIDNYMKYIEKEKYLYVSLSELLNIFHDFYKGIITIDFEEGNVNINVASTIAAALDYIIIPNSLRENDFYSYLFINNNTIIIDNNENLDYIDFQDKYFEMYKNHLNKNGLIHQVTIKDNYHLTLRDEGISNKWFTFYTGETHKAKLFRKKVLEWADKNIPIYGWTTDEIDFVDDISQYGDYVIPSDWSSNHSFLNKFPHTILKQINTINRNIEENKHYLTIVVSDGDNVQWLERDFSTSSTFGQRKRSNLKYPINFTIAPSMVKSSPKVIEYLYSLSDNEYFVSGVSGAGYMNPAAFSPIFLPEFTKNTSSLMKDADLNIVTILDNMKNINNIQNAINSYAKHENIIGGIYELDPTKYEGGKGEIFFSDNGKPFASVRVSFWSDDGTNETVTDEWINSLATKINNFKVDKYAKEGYTVLNVHPWSTTINDLDKLISKLDSHIQIIRCDDFLNLIKNNIKR